MSTLPEYPCDLNKYEAMCNWLETEPFSHFVYEALETPFTSGEKGHFYDRELVKQGLSAMAQDCGLTMPDISAEAVEFFFKHLYRGMAKAHQQGIVNHPEMLGMLGPESDYLPEKPAVILVSDDKVTMVLHLPTLLGKLSEIEDKLSKGIGRYIQIAEAQDIEKLGFELQCRAHFMHDNKDRYLSGFGMDQKTYFTKEEQFVDDSLKVYRRINMRSAAASQRLPN